MENPDQSIATARKLHSAGDLAAAQMLYQQVLLTLPNHPDALHFLGLLKFQHGNREEGMNLVRRALAVDPDYVDAWNNLGNMLRIEKNQEEARSAYRKVLDLRPDHSDALNNLGLILKREAKYEEAAAAYRKAIKSDPNLFEAYENLGSVLLTLRRFAEAAPVYREWLSREPGSATARHMVACCEGEMESWPDRASDEYVVETFDRYASTFNQALERLKYRAPGLVRDALERGRPEAGKDLVLVDAGCGTGLLGPLIEPWARRLIGVDLSSKMLDEARETGVYDELVEAELTEWLERNGPLDAILSADTLPYFGELSPVFRAVANSLAPDGFFVFTVEDGGDAEFRLDPRGRYSHGEAYVRRTLEDACLAVEDIGREVLRKEGGEDVAGLVVTAVPISR